MLCFYRKNSGMAWDPSELSYWIIRGASHHKTDTAEGTPSSWLPISVCVSVYTRPPLTSKVWSIKRTHSRQWTPQLCPWEKTHIHTHTNTHLRHTSPVWFCIVMTEQDKDPTSRDTVFNPNLTRLSSWSLIKTSNKRTDPMPFIFLHFIKPKITWDWEVWNVCVLFLLMFKHYKLTDSENQGVCGIWGGEGRLWLRRSELDYDYSLDRHSVSDTGQLWGALPSL